MRAAKLPVGLLACLAALLLSPAPSLAQGFEDEFEDEFADEFPEEEQPAPAEEEQEPAPPADEGGGGEFESEFDAPLEAEGGAEAEAGAGGEAAAGAEGAGAESDLEAAEAEGGIAVGTETTEVETTGAAGEDEESDVRERRFRNHNTVDGPVGGIRVVDAGSAAVDSFRLQLAAEFFKTSSFLQKGDTQDRIGGTLSASWTPLEFLELYANVAVSASNNTEGDPTLLQVLGDTLFGIKGAWWATPFLALGGDFGIAFLNSVGDIGLVGESTSFGLRANLTADLRGLESSVPFIARLNLQYFFDRSEELVQGVENRRYENLDDPAPRENEFRHLVTREERYGLNINRTDFFNIGLGFEIPLRAMEDFYIHPILEWTWNIPVNRQGFDCLYVADDDSGSDSCLDREGVSSFPMDITLGLRVLPPIEGLSLLAAVDIGATGTSRGDMVRELAANEPYNVIFSAGYAYDTSPRPPKVITKTVEKRVEVEKAPLEGRIEGLVIEKGNEMPVAEATVRFPEHDASPILSGEDGRFVSYRFPPGEVTMELSHPDYHDGTCAATIPDERPEEGEIRTEVTCELEALPKVGDVEGKIVGEEGEGISGASIELEGPQSKSVTSGSGGTFTAAELEPGTYTARVEHEDYLIKIDQFQVEGRETAQPVIQLIKKPRRPSVRVRRRQIVIRRQINFSTDSAEINPNSYDLLNEIADVMIRNPQLEKIEIQGHTDNRGGARHNMELSQNRAQSVKDWLVEHGVDASRLEAKGFGQSRPLVPNITPANRARNRRVQFIIRERNEEEGSE